MDIRIIAFGMVAVLLALFLGAKLYIPRERSKTKWEANYAQAAQAFFKVSSLENYENCLNALKMGYSDDESAIKKKLEKDRIIKPL